MNAQQLSLLDELEQIENRSLLLVREAVKKSISGADKTSELRQIADLSNKYRDLIRPIRPKTAA